jgi:KipI family sensor histidine kinase inhibitor
MLGFAPGFPFLIGLDAALAMPRLTSPRTRVPGGSVAIGGQQTGIYPRESPGGWRIVGRTPLILFDPQRDLPALLAPGDRVRFVPVDTQAFARHGTVR